MYRKLKLSLLLIGFFSFGIVLSQEFSCLERTDNQIRTMIVGSTDVYSKTDYPWLVNLSVGAAPFCGGSLINNTTVLTAAHCLKYVDNTIIRRVGEDGTPYGESLKVRDFIIHQEYNPSVSYGNDIALLKLDGAFEVTEVELPRLLSPNLAETWGQTDDCSRVIGWGVTTQGAPNTSDVLLGADLPLWSNEECQQSYGGLIEQGNVCAGYREGLMNSCQGDSGGPLMVRGGPTGNLIVGIVSYAIGCAEPNYPTVYARVSHYYDWIFESAKTLEVKR